jgi:hypothetical protein
MLKTHIQSIVAFFNANLREINKPDQTTSQLRSAEQTHWHRYFVDGVDHRPDKTLQPLQPARWLVFLQRILASVLMPDTEPRIQEYRDRSGQLYWDVYDPATNRAHTFGSEAEIYEWIERRYSE